MKHLSIILIILFTFNANAQKLKPFALPELKSGKVFNLSDYIGKKKILINFFASWCTACVAELSELNHLKEKYESNNYLFIAVNAGERKKMVKKFLKRNTFSYLILMDKDRQISKSLKIDSLPRTLVIDLKGNITFTDKRPPKSL